MSPLLLNLQYQRHFLAVARLTVFPGWSYSRRLLANLTGERLQSLTGAGSVMALLVVWIPEEESSFSVSSDDDHPAGQSYGAQSNYQEYSGDDQHQEIFPGVLTKLISRLDPGAPLPDCRPVAGGGAGALELRQGWVPRGEAWEAGEGDQTGLQESHVSVGWAGRRL